MNNFFKAAVLALSLIATPLFAANPVDVNQADAQTLAANLSGIGMSKAEAIVAYREANGPFADADALIAVKGVGMKTVDRNRDLIRTGAEDRG